MKFPKYDFKHYWYKLLIFFLFDTFVILLIGYLSFGYSHPEIFPDEIINYGPFDLTYYQWFTIICFNLALYITFGLIKTIWSLLFDWSIKGFKKGNKDNE